MNELNAEYWSNRYQNNQTGWDLGEISLPIKEYFDQIENKELRILIPGCGRGHEGIYLWRNDFKNVSFADFSPEVMEIIKLEIPNIPDNQLICQDFFTIEGNFDLIIEQTMFCAIDPTLRSLYVEKIAQLLCPKGKIVGVLFNREFDGGPPFGGSKNEYLSLFKSHFKNIHLENCYNSVEPRKNTEVFLKAIKK